MLTSHVENETREVSGRFGAGNQFGKLPRRKRGQRRRDRLSKAIAEAVTSQDLRAVVRVLLDRAKAGNVTACREVLARALGKPRMAVPSAPIAPEPVETAYDGEWAARHIARLVREKAQRRSG